MHVCRDIHLSTVVPWFPRESDGVEETAHRGLTVHGATDKTACFAPFGHSPGNLCDQCGVWRKQQACCVVSRVLSRDATSNDGREADTPGYSQPALEPFSPTGSQAGFVPVQDLHNRKGMSKLS